MSKKGDILILSAGRRVELIQDFKAEAVKFSDGIRILTIDMSPCMSSACHVSDDALSVLSIQSKDYTGRIFGLVAERDIGSVIPIIGTELCRLSEVRIRFEEASIHIVISDSELVTLYRDKRKTVGLFARHGIRSPEVYDRNRPVYPCFIKPYNGSRVIGAKRLNRVADLMPETLTNSKLMFCQLIDITEELQGSIVGMYYDRKDRLKRAVPHERLEVHAGGVSKDVTHRNSLHGLLTENIIVPEGACDYITAQLFFNGRNDALYGVEINSRFGGGFLLTHATGGNYPGWLTRECLYGEEILFSNQWENNPIILRYDAKV